MVGEEQQRDDAPTITRTCRVDMGTYTPGTHYTEVTLPFKRVLAVSWVNLANDTNYVIPIRVVSPNVLRFWAGVCQAGAATEMGAAAVGEAEIECVLPNE